MAPQKKKIYNVVKSHNRVGQWPVTVLDMIHLSNVRLNRMVVPDLQYRIQQRPESLFRIARTTSTSIIAILYIC